MDMAESVVFNKIEMMDEAGASRAASYRVLAESLTAYDVVLDKFGGEHEVPNHGARLKAAETIARMNGDIKPSGEISIVQNTINITDERLEELMKEYGKPRILRQSGEVIDVGEATRAISK